MRITNLKIDRYRSLYAVDVDLLPVVTLVGANGSGKSNFVDALHFLAVALSNGLEAAVNVKGGPEQFSFRWGKRTTQPVSIQATVRLAISEIQSPRPGLLGYLDRSAAEGRRLPDLDVVYGFGIAAHGQNGLGDFSIAFETIEVRTVQESSRPPILSIRRTGDGVTPVVYDTDQIEQELRTELAWPFEDDSFRDVLSKAERREHLLIGALALFNPTIAAVARTLGQVQTYSIIPGAGKLPGLPPPVGQLDRSGANLPSAVKALQENFHEAWVRILERMQELEPRFSAISASLTGERRLVLEFGELGARRPWSATEVSDGTIRMLALLTALYDPRAPIVAIEEPENFIHPWMVRTFVEACRDAIASGGKQVILTSHSPALIDFFAPEEIYVVWRVASGRSSIAPLPTLDPDLRAIWERGDASLFDLLDSGLVREAVPGVSE